MCDDFDNIIYWTKDLNITLNHNQPKSHYCDEPLVLREHLADLSIPKKIDPPITGFIFDKKPEVLCPYCHSKNTKKIFGMLKAGLVALYGIFTMGKVNKQWHCDSCGSDF